MDLDWLWVSAAFLLGGYIFVIKFLRRVNGWYYDLKVRKNKCQLPPGDMGWPLLGDMLTFTTAFKSGDPESFINRIVSRYGQTGIYKTHLFGNPSIILCTPETCRRVLTDDDNFKIGYPKSTLQLLASSSFQSFSNAERRRLRRLTTSPIAGHAVLGKYIVRIEEDVMSSLEEWASISMKHPLELIRELTRVTFKTIIPIFMGIHHNDQILMKIEYLFTDMMKGIFVSAIDIPGFAFHKALKARNKLVKILESVVEERRRIIKEYPLEKTKDLIDTLLEVEDDKGAKLENEDIIELLLSYLAAGHESTSHGIMWSLIYLTQNPHIMNKAKEEQERIVKARPSSQKRLNLKEIKQMDYLAKVIDEMLRRTNIIFSIFREANVDVEMNGYTIPRGWKVLIWSRAIHMDSEYYLHPQEYNPSRWDDSDAKTRAFFPFGAGSRFCPGSDLAKLKISIFLHHFLLDYKLELVNSRCPVSYLPGPCPTDKCLAKVIKIS